jgi:succinoglycan biosynthesis protein ExoA
MTGMATAPRVSLLIAVRNEGKHLSRTLESVCAQTCPPEWLEVLVLDGGSSDDTVAIAESFASRLPHLRVINNPGVLSAAGWNVGLREAGAPLVSILSGHTQLPADYFSFVLSEMTPDRAGVGVRAVPNGDDERSALIATAFSSLLGNGGASFMNADRSGPVESIAFGCYWRHIVQLAGGFDERIVRGQDWDLNLRLRARGFELWYFPQREVRYFTRSTYKALWRRQFLAGKWKRYIHLKSGAPFLLRHKLPAIFVFGLGAAILTSVIWWPVWWIVAFIVLAHQSASLLQLRKLRLPWRQALAFWWSVWLIHAGYGTGMIAGFVDPFFRKTTRLPV